MEIEVCLLNNHYINNFMITVTLDDIDLKSIMNIVYNLRHSGYEQGKDFDFAYFPERVQFTLDFGDVVRRPRRTEFRFNNEELALFFQLKHK